MMPILSKLLKQISFSVVYCNITSAFCDDIQNTEYMYMTAHARINEFQGGASGPCPQLGPNKFYERPSSASRTQENHIAAGPLPRAPLGSLQRFHRPSRRLPTPKNLTPLSALWASGFGPSCLAPDPNSKNRRRSPSEHDGLGPPTPARKRQWHSCTTVSLGLYKRDAEIDQPRFLTPADETQRTE